MRIDLYTRSTYTRAYTVCHSEKNQECVLETLFMLVNTVLYQCMLLPSFIKKIGKAPKYLRKS